jgi:hypothetical protein
MFRITGTLTAEPIIPQKEQLEHFHPENVRIGFSMVGDYGLSNLVIGGKDKYIEILKINAIDNFSVVFDRLIKQYKGE